MKTTVGYIRVGQEFTLRGRTFKRIDASTWAYHGTYVLPNAVGGNPLYSHQNTIPVMCKEDGLLYNVECSERCELNG